MAFASLVPDSGGESGSSTATFGDSIGHVFAMPNRQSDTSSAAEGSEVDVVMPLRQPRRKPQGSNSASPGARSPGHATSPRHGSATSPTSRMTPSQSRSTGSQGKRTQDQRGRSGSRNLSDAVGGFQEQSERSPYSPMGSHIEAMPRDRSHYGSPSQRVNQWLDHLPLYQHDLTHQHFHPTIRTHLPEWIRQLGRLKTIDGHQEEPKRSEQWITDPCHRRRRESDLTVRPLEHQILTRGEMLYPTIRVTTLQQFHQQSL